MAKLAYPGGKRGPSLKSGLKIAKIHAMLFILHPVHYVLIMFIAWRTTNLRRSDAVVSRLVLSYLSQACLDENAESEKRGDADSGGFDAVVSGSIVIHVFQVKSQAKTMKFFQIPKDILYEEG